MSQLGLLDLFRNSLLLYFSSNNSPCNFNFIGKIVPFPSTDIIVVALFCCSSAFFFRKVSFCFFSLPSFWMKLLNQKVKHHLVNYLMVILAIYFWYKAFKVKRFSKIYTFKKVKDSIDYDSLKMLYQPIKRPWKYIFLMCFEYTKLHGIEKTQRTR